MYDKYHNKTHIHEVYQGYGAKESFVNLQNIKPWRLNRVDSPCLYVSDKIEGSIVEVRPRAQTLVSVAEVQCNELLNIVDCSKSLLSGYDSEYEMMLYSSICSEYSRPSYDNDNKTNYILTQHISEYIRALGYDGIQFCSSYTQNTYETCFDNSRYLNLGIFNYNKLTPINSKLYLVKKVRAEFHGIEYDEINKFAKIYRYYPFYDESKFIV